MNNPKQIKQYLTPIMVAERYLGQPDKRNRDRLWYKSPFRKEKTASFMVDNKSFHDFGDNWDGDVISFIERYYNTNFTNAMKILSSDFGLPDTEQISKELGQYLKKKRDDEIKIRRNLDKWFNETYCKLCECLQLWEKAIPVIKDEEVLATAYSESNYLEYLIDLFFKSTEDEKIALWRDRDKIEKVIFVR